MDRARLAGVEIYFSLPEVCELLSLKYNSLRALLSIHKERFDPPRYRTGRVGRMHRVLSARDVRTLVEMVNKRQPHWNSKEYTNG